MDTIFALDANVIIHYLRENENVTKNFDNAVVEGSKLLIPRAVDYEIRRGLELLNATKKTAIYNDMVGINGQCLVTDMGEDIWTIAKDIYVKLHRQSLTVGEIDILIAAFCLRHGFTLVTANTKDFVNIPEIQLENWWK